MEHTELCVRKTNQRNYERAAYAAQWPKRCKTCNGYGMHVFAGAWVPYGLTSAQLPDDREPCVDCVEQGLCPRCGGFNPDEEAFCDPEDMCIHCGWKDDGSGGLPDQWECDCWEFRS